MADEEVWRRRFQLFVLVRLFGLATFVVGVLVIYTDLLRPGGWPAIGAILAIIGALNAVLAPKMLKKLWEQQDREAR